MSNVSISTNRTNDATTHDGGMQMVASKKVGCSYAIKE